MRHNPLYFAPTKCEVTMNAIIAMVVFHKWGDWFSCMDNQSDDK